MPQIGWFEILIIFSVAILILGPKDFPVMIKKVGSWIGSTKRYINNVTSQVSDITDLDNDTKDQNNKKNKKSE